MDSSKLQPEQQQPFVEEEAHAGTEPWLLQRVPKPTIRLRKGNSCHLYALHLRPITKMTISVVLLQLK